MWCELMSKKLSPLVFGVSGDISCIAAGAEAMDEKEWREGLSGCSSGKPPRTGGLCWLRGELSIELGLGKMDDCI